MTRRKILLIALTVVVLVGGILGGIQIVRAIQGGDPNTDMTKSVARVIWNGKIEGKQNSETCTGSVVGNGWVLTALHCWYPTDNLADPPLGWHGYKVQLWQDGMNQSQKYEASLDRDPIPMPGAYTKGNALYRDVMLLHVNVSDKDNPMPSWVKTIPMALDWPPSGTTLTEYGYGLLNYYKDQTPTPATSLNESKLGSITRADCPTHSGYQWTNGHICTGVNPDGSLPLPGDSGGPLVWRVNGYLQQVGTFSLFPNNKDTDQNWRSYWSEADGDTRTWILSYVLSELSSDGKSPYKFSTDSKTHSVLPLVGKILRDPASGMSWLYESDGYRRWIPDGKIYNCLISNGATVVNYNTDASKSGLPLRTIEALPDMKDHWASCTLRPAPTSPPAPMATVTPNSHPVPTATPNNRPAPTVTPHSATSTAPYETAGPTGGDTFTNPANAGAPLGQRVGDYQTIKMSCRLTGWKAQDGNNWWYRIASSPWNNAFYAPADNYYNNGATSGSLSGTPWVDTNIPVCSAPPPPPHTYAETAGPTGGDTFTNPANAGAPLGQRVGDYQTIQVTCRLTGWKAQDGNTWWYKIASSPWNNAFYATADNYYNNGATSGSLHGTPFVDTAVPMC